jgi:hypothetical protein
MTSGAGLRHAARAQPGAGKVAARLASPEPQLQYAALRLTARGREIAPQPARSRGSPVVGLGVASSAKPGRRPAKAIAARLRQVTVRRRRFS